MNPLLKTEQRRFSIKRITLAEFDKHCKDFDLDPSKIVQSLLEEYLK